MHDWKIWKMKKAKPFPLRGFLLICVMLGLMSSCASVRSERVSPRLHPNLAAAQTFVERAMDKLSMAQRANDFDMGGHAARAKSLLDDAYVEIKSAALAANAHR